MRRTLIAWMVCLLVAVAMCLPMLAAESATSAVGKSIAAFSLQDFRGKQVALGDFPEAKAVVVVFLGVECPLAKLYGPRLMELAEAYQAQGVQFIGIDSNRQDSITELAAYARAHGIEFPVLKDAGNVVADQFGAQRTPEVFLLDAERVVRYHGRIDDQYGFTTGGGYARPEIRHRDLAAALDALLAGQPVTTTETEVPGCIIGRIKTPQADAPVTYSNQIARILQERCAECHRPGQIAPFSLTSYDEVVGWAEMIDEVVRDNRMPPWHADPHYGHFSNDARLTPEQLQQIHDWVAAGAPEGDRAELPEPREYVTGWQMPFEPDQVVYMSDEAYHVPAEGVVDYQYFTVDPGFTEDKWLKTAECVPGNRGVVHHIIVFARPPESRAKDARGFHFVAGFAPGTRPFVFPDGMAKLIPAGSKLIFQMHYTPNGTPQDDRSSIGLKFTDAKGVTHRVATDRAINHNFRIPAGDPNYEVTARRKFLDDALILAYFPHMHLRGKSFRYIAELPDGSSEIVLDVPRYDFNWQNHFILSQPRKMPAGSAIRCIAHFDNSADNLANPDPQSDVLWGDQTFEEMMIGWFDIAVPYDPAHPGGEVTTDDGDSTGE
ncbi:MAG: redoxin domain-containing protein [Pirellulales bacterium]|nr:redoxin domain-containing protein [Pirellulales bacterium]